ncbi:MAG: HD domain-containing protein [Anaerovoracaceae bacterium]
MNISEIRDTKDRTHISFKGMLSEVKVLESSTGSSYINITFQDKDDAISFPIWDNIDEIKGYETGQVYVISGQKASWNNTPQIKSPLILKCDDAKPEDYVPSYDITNEHIGEFNWIVDNLCEPYKSTMRAALNKLGDSFYTSVSATRHHGNKRGGLLLHTIGVVRNVESMIKNYSDNKLIDNYDITSLINKDRLIFKALWHDIMKVYEYDSVAIKIRPNSVSHIYRSVAFLEAILYHNKDIDFPEEEFASVAKSILSHHGQYGPEEPKTIEDYMLHLADMIDAKIVGECEK